MPKKSYQKRRTTKRRQRGGNGANANPIPNYSSQAAGSAAAFGVQAYGGIGQQNAIPGTNQLAVNHVPNCGGGKKKRSKSHKKTCKNKK